MPERLVQSDGGKLAGTVVHQLVGAAVARQAGHVDDVALLLVNHVGHEGLLEGQKSAVKSI